MKYVIIISVLLLTIGVFQVATAPDADEFEFFWEGPEPITTLNLGE